MSWITCTLIGSRSTSSAVFSTSARGVNVPATEVRLVAWLRVPGPAYRLEEYASSEASIWRDESLSSGSPRLSQLDPPSLSSRSSSQLHLILICGLNPSSISDVLVAR